MKRILLSAVLMVGMALPVSAASLAKTYSYFTIGGRTLEEIEKELSVRGPHVNSTGKRHPGATQMEFTSRIGYGQDRRGCSIRSAEVTVRAKMFLPRWRQRGRVQDDVKLIWGTLAGDIKRHEESHVIIAKNHARELEQSLKRIGRQRSCAIAAQKAKKVTERLLAKHDRAQADFDRVESINFESRILRLLEYRLERMAAQAARKTD